jgi:NADPH:quinone reductase-like Zn-dependent oxidoreductase/acyl carrier protein
LTFEEAATLPVAFLTAHYALNQLGRLARGERVLIHAATGGVGLAAIQLARAAGAEIFATAGTEEKRRLLRALGVRLVMDSRSLEFADRVLEATDGEGVDVVLNSLAGRAIDKGLSVLRDHGRFLEIGKRDIYQNRRIGLRPFRRSLSFVGIDLDREMRSRPEQLSALFRELMQRFDTGELAPITHRTFPIGGVVGAFRHMAQAKHIGKVVVSMQEPEVSAVPLVEEGIRFREDGTYLITGGLGGFGLTVADWLVNQGARHVALVGRSGAATDEARQAVEALRERGAEVRVVQADVSDPDEVGRVLDGIEDSMPPLRGIFHAAMVLRDRLALGLDEEHLRDVWGPKIVGAWNLHVRTRQRELDCFVLFSSMAGVIGAGGQANYAAANTFLDALAFHRRARGLPALAVSWGYLGEVGFVARHSAVGERFEAIGVKSFSPRQALRLLGRFLRQQRTHVGVMRVEWGQWARAASAFAIPPRFQQLADEAADDEGSLGTSGAAIRRALLAADPSERRDLITSLIRDHVARILGHSADQLDLERPLADLGLDSLMAVELRNWIEGELRVTLPAAELLRGPSVSRLTDLLLEQLADGESGPKGAAADEIPAAAGEDAEQREAEELLAQVDELPDEQVDKLLDRMETGRAEQV